MPIPYPLFPAAFILGLIVGSFLNAAIYRLRERKGLGGRSACPHCRHQLGVKDLIPLFSYLATKGKCRYCKKLIGSHYFWTELTTGIVFLGTAWIIGLSDPTKLIYNLIFVSALVFLATYDWIYGEIPDQVSLPALGLALLSSLLPFTLNFSQSLLGALIGGGTFLLLVVVSKGRWMGGGDIRIMALIGALTGWPLVLIAIFLGALIGSFAGLVQIQQKKKNLISPIRSGPAFALGGYLTLLFGNNIWTWYLLNFL